MRTKCPVCFSVRGFSDDCTLIRSQYMDYCMIGHSASYDRAVSENRPEIDQWILAVAMFWMHREVLNVAIVIQNLVDTMGPKCPQLMSRARHKPRHRGQWLWCPLRLALRAQKFLSHFPLANAMPSWYGLEKGALQFSYVKPWMRNVSLAF
jgi:hypothetical protein